jgi:hypothetical protein
MNLAVLSDAGVIQALGFVGALNYCLNQVHLYLLFNVLIK